jgi:RNA polymerase sigma-70 factor (ECF subfamily)
VIESLNRVPNVVESLCSIGWICIALHINIYLADIDRFALVIDRIRTKGAPMSESQSGFQSLMEQIAAGSESAVEKLVCLYGSQLSRAVRRRMHPRLRTKFDTSDFAQAVWASFFYDREGLGRFEHSRDFVAFLTRMAQNKVVDECRRRLQTQKRNVTRECSISADASEEIVVPSREPPPSQIAIRNEQWQRMMEGLPTQYRQILELRVAGETQEEIARRLGISERTVRRVLSKLQLQVEASR